MMRRAGIRPQPTGSVSLRPGTPFTRHAGFAHIGGREELIGLPGRYATPNGNIGARVIKGESAWKRAAAANVEPTTYVSLGQHSAYRNGYTILARIKVGVYASIESAIWSSYYDSTAANFDANGLAVGMNVVENIQCINYNGIDRLAQTGPYTVMRGQWHNVVFVCGRTTDGLTTEGTWYREIWVNGRLRATSRHPSIAQTWGMSEIGILGSRYAEDPTGVDRDFPELALFAVSFENLRQDESKQASLDPYGYLFGDQRIWVPVSVAGGDIPTLSLPGVQSITTTGATPKVTLTFA